LLVEASAGHVLESRQRLSQSRLWQLQRELYDEGMAFVCCTSGITSVPTNCIDS
jgi:hypothetical protein